MGLLDHQRTWHFKVSATPEACVGAFRAAMSGKMKLRAVNWDIRVDKLRWFATNETVSGVTATYVGRAGLAAGLTILFGARGNQAEERAIGSEMSFAVRPLSTTSTECALWMGTVGTTFGLTQDAGYFRSYMSDVEKELRVLDPNITTSKV